MKRYTTLLVALSLAFVFAACDDGSNVGSSVSTVPGGGEDGAIRDTTTTTPPTTETPPTTTRAQVTTTRPTPTTSPPTTAAGPTVALTIGIFSDTSGKNQFEPRQGAVKSGQTVRFQNNDTQTRGVEDSGGAWRSPDIAPGGFWDFKTSSPGTYNYNDTTRPYAVGQLVVR